MGGQYEREYRSAAVKTAEVLDTIEALLGVAGTEASGSFCSRFGRLPNGSVERGAAWCTRMIKVATHDLKVIICYSCRKKKKTSRVFLIQTTGSGSRTSIESRRLLRSVYRSLSALQWVRQATSRIALR